MNESNSNDFRLNSTEPRDEGARAESPAYESPRVSVQRIALVTRGGTPNPEDSDPPNTGFPS